MRFNRGFLYKLIEQTTCRETGLSMKKSLLCNFLNGVLHTFEIHTWVKNQLFGEKMVLPVCIGYSILMIERRVAIV